MLCLDGFVSCKKSFYICEGLYIKFGTLWEDKVLSTASPGAYK